MVGMSQRVNQQTRGGLRLFFNTEGVEGKLRYNRNGKAKTKQPKKSDVLVVADKKKEQQRGTA
jgi:hypothetical protein